MDDFNAFCDELEPVVIDTEFEELEALCEEYDLVNDQQTEFDNE